METDNNTDILNADNDKNMEIYIGWFAMWVLFGCMSKEFFRTYEDITAEKVKRLHERTIELAEHIIYCKESGLLKIEDVDRGGGYEDIIRGLHTIESKTEQQDAEEITLKKWTELEGIFIQIKIHAWAQKIRASTMIKRV